MRSNHKSDVELFAEGLGKSSAYFRQIMASRGRIQSHLQQLLESGLRKK